MPFNFWDVGACNCACPCSLPSTDLAAALTKAAASSHGTLTYTPSGVRGARQWAGELTGPLGTFWVIIGLVPAGIGVENQFWEWAFFACDPDTAPDIDVWLYTCPFPSTPDVLALDYAQANETCGAGAYAVAATVEMTVEPDSTCDPLDVGFLSTDGYELRITP